MATCESSENQGEEEEEPNGHEECKKNENGQKQRQDRDQQKVTGQKIDAEMDRNKLKGREGEKGPLESPSFSGRRSHRSLLRLEEQRKTDGGEVRDGERVRMKRRRGGERREVG
ncbi:hypothetical protein EYF80_043502 [Liparis tanakae]|uniref:Uncharacterized protein n=1 Tax=Liparis tanakae TaxID=230148 RepID=A0A4Z2G0F2_9TELE|nr:hypothetical protein EYF80_043502 [Liparis tanakae]